MFVCNISLSRNWLKMLVVGLVILVLVVVFFVVGFRFYSSTSRVMVKDDGNSSSVGDNYIGISSGNYASVLKDAHENVDMYVGKKVNFSGFVYRLYDFSEKQFVLGREMIISSDNQAVVVGFLCEGPDNDVDMHSFKDHCWVEVEGVIRKGEYHGERPIIEVTFIKETNVPEDEFVYPPDGSFVREI